ncbi:hypothetical protein [Sphingomonas oryzagri]
MIDQLVEDTADTCRQDDGYLLSIVRAYWGSMDDAQLAYAFRSLLPDDDDIPADEEEDSLEADDGVPGSVEVRFVPQAWINDQAVTVDGEQPDTWFVPLHYLLEEFPTEEDWIRNGSRRDEMIWSDVVPRWVREWLSTAEQNPATVAE